MDELVLKTTIDNSYRPISITGEPVNHKFTQHHVCFYNTYHFGDIFFTQPAIKHICDANPNVTFYYWFSVGHAVYDGIPNLIHLEPIDDVISSKIITEKDSMRYENNNINMFEKYHHFFYEPYPLMSKDFSTFEYQEKSFIAFNTWWWSIFYGEDMNHVCVLEGFKKKMNVLNNTFGMFSGAAGVGKLTNDEGRSLESFGLSMNFDFDNHTPLNIYNGTPEGVLSDVSRATLPINQLKSTDIKDVRSNSNVHRCKMFPELGLIQSTDRFSEWIQLKHNKNLVFIYNYEPRAVSFMDKQTINTIIGDICRSNPHVHIIVPRYDTIFDGIENITCCDRDFGFTENRSCTNLLQIEHVLQYCRMVVTLPSGSTWTFMNRDISSYADRTIFYLWGDYEVYATKLNNWYKYGTGKTDDIIQCIGINELALLVRNFNY